MPGRGDVSRGERKCEGRRIELHQWCRSDVVSLRRRGIVVPVAVNHPIAKVPHSVAMTELD